MAFFYSRNPTTIICGLLMKTINVSYEKKSDLLVAHEEAREYQPENILIQVFSGITDENVISRLQLELKELFPGASVIGATSDGEIIQAKVQTQSIVVSISFFSYTKVHPIIILQNDSMEDAANEIADEFGKYDSKVVIVFGSGLKQGCFRNDLAFLEILKKRLGNTIIAGGQSGNDFSTGKTLLFNADTIFENGYIGVSLSGSRLRVKNDYTLGWVPMGRTMVVTKANANVLYSIDGVSVGDVYKKYLGIDADSVEHRRARHLFPLTVVRDGIVSTASPYKGNPDGSHIFSHAFHVGESVRFSYSDEITLIDCLRELKKRTDQYIPQSVFIYSCSARRVLLEEHIKFDEKILESYPANAGFFTFGEYYTTDNNQIRSFQQTMTILMLSESDDFYRSHAASTDDFSLYESNSPGLLLQKILKNLVASTTKELEQKNRELADLVNLDAMTGLANRRKLDDVLLSELKRKGRSDRPLSLIMMDVDYFKLYNDRYGHVAGDDCLKGIACVLKEVIKRPSDLVFRYGGEEFGCVLPMTDNKGAIQIAEQIRKSVEALKIPHANSKVSDRVTISLGVLTLDDSNEMKPEDFVVACDKMLYKAKHSGRNRVAY